MREHDLTDEDRQWRMFVQRDIRRGSDYSFIAKALGISEGHLRNATTPSTPAEKHSALTVERYRTVLRLANSFESLIELNRSLGFIALPIKPARKEDDPFVALASVTEEIGEAAAKLVKAKRKEGAGGSHITSAEAKEFHKEMMEMISAAVALVEIVLEEAHITPEG